MALNRSVTPLAAAVLIAAVASSHAAQNTPPQAPAPTPDLQLAPQGPGRRTSPPQPQQPRGIEYLAGAWTFVWTGRESPITAGPREATTTFTPAADGKRLTVVSEGKTDAGATFKESGTADWNDTTKVLTTAETVSGAALRCAGDWSSPLSVRFDCTPVTVQGLAIKLRRTYSIRSRQSFSVTEEISTNGGPFQRLGNGEFTRK